jgi:hypothetical protein
LHAGAITLSSSGSYLTPFTVTSTGEINAGDSGVTIAAISFRDGQSVATHCQIERAELRIRFLAAFGHHE